MGSLQFCFSRSILKHRTYLPLPGLGWVLRILLFATPVGIASASGVCAGIPNGLGGTGVEAGITNTCVLTADGNVACYGSNSVGESAPYEGGDAIGVAAGYLHTCVLTADGNVDCYGSNVAGQAADYTDGDAIGVAAGAQHTCVLTADGNVDCYGFNGNGQANDYLEEDAVCSGDYGSLLGALRECESDKGALQSDLLACEDDNTQLENQLSACESANADLQTANDNLTAANDTLTTEKRQLQRLLNGCQSTNAILLTLNQELGEANEALTTENQILQSLVADDDADGVYNDFDTCPDTEPAAAVDATGCSLPQFCEAIDFRLLDPWVICAASDWMADEPLGQPRDCRLSLRQRACVVND